jgi:hypothetical protein
LSANQWKKKLDTWRRPSYPNDLPRAARTGALEHAEVAGFCGIHTISAPAPDELIGLVCEDGWLHLSPEQKVLDTISAPALDELIGLVCEDGWLHLSPEQKVFAQFVDAKYAVDVARPVVAKQPIPDRSRLSSPLRDASVKLRGDLTDRLAVDPSVLP